jgi:hypothetical protein
MDCVLFYGFSFMPGAYKPAGPFRVATVLRESGFSTQCVDVGPLNASRDCQLIDRIVDKFVTSETLWVGFSTTFLTHILGYLLTGGDDTFLTRFVAKCREKNPDIKLIAGGVFHANLEKYGFYSFIGFADTEIVEFTKWLRDSKYKPKIQRLGKTITGQEFANFSTSQIRWDKSDIIDPNETLPIEVSRGCIFRCKFCAFPLNGKTKGEWVKDEKTLYDELLYNYDTFGVTRYIFSDDTYNDSLEKIRSLCENVFTKLPFKIDFTTYLRLDLMHRFREEAQILVDSGLKSAMLGIETNNDRSAKSIGKGLSFQKQIEYLHELKQGVMKDVLVSSGFIVGLPHDTVESIEQLRDFLLSPENPLDDWGVSPLSLTPANKTLHKKYFSEFELEHSKYGYELDDEKLPGVEGLFRARWSLKSQGLDSDLCRKYADEINLKSEELPNSKFGMGKYGRYAAIIPAVDLRSKSKTQIKSEYSIESLMKTYIQDYYKKLL